MQTMNGTLIDVLLYMHDSNHCLAIFQGSKTYSHPSVFLTKYTSTNKVLVQLVKFKKIYFFLCFSGFPVRVQQTKGLQVFFAV